MSEILGKVGGLFTGGNLGKTLSVAPVALGEIGNLVTSAQRGGQIDALTKQENAISSLSPAALTAMVRSAQAPISQGLRNDVGNSVQADLAQRGLAQAPGIFATTQEQALAPFEQQNYQTALQQTLVKLGLPLDYARTILSATPGNADLSKAIALMLQQFQKSGPATPPGGSIPLTGLTAPNNWGGASAADGGYPSLDTSALGINS